MKSLLMLFTVIFLVGCASQPNEVIITKEVKVPVYQKVNIPKREIPKLPVNRLNSKSTPKEVATAYDSTVTILLNEVKWYRAMIDKLDE